MIQSWTMDHHKGWGNGFNGKLENITHRKNNLLMLRFLVWRPSKCWMYFLWTRKSRHVWSRDGWWLGWGIQWSYTKPSTFSSRLIKVRYTKKAKRHGTFIRFIWKESLSIWSWKVTWIFLTLTVYFPMNKKERVGVDGLKGMQWSSTKPSTSRHAQIKS